MMFSQGSWQTMIQKPAKFLALLFALTAILTGCNTSSGGGGGSSPAPTATLTANPAAMFPGLSSTLTFTSTNATMGSIANGVAQGINGTVVVSPTTTTTYTFTATGPGGTATATATVTIFPGNSFPGMSEADSIKPLGTPDIDPNGAVGTKQFMEYVNSQYQAYDKTTFEPVSTPQSIVTPWQSPANVPPIAACSGNNITIDAVINFDRLASRWVMAAKSTDTNGNYYFCIAVSSVADLTSTSPPLGWYAYVYPLDAVLGHDAGETTYLPDWPKLGTWPDAYYATMDLFDVPTSTEVGVLACAFDRTNMLLGKPMSTPQCFTGPDTLLSNGIYLGHSLIPADVDGTTAPPTGRDEFMVSIENPINDGTTTTSSTINLWDFHVDWTTPANSTFTLTSPTVDTYTPGCYLFKALPGITNCVPEPPSGTTPQFIDSVGDRLMPRFAYRNFGTYESYLVSHTVQTGPGGSGPNALQTGVRWYELRANGTGTPAVNQEGTINPDNSLFRFLPSIAQDQAGNAAVGYSVSNTSTDPEINFSYWSLTNPDPPTEVNILNGTGGEEVTPTGFGEWGTYSSMTVDPTDDCTFWYVNEYWVPTPTSSAWSTNIANFKMPNCPATPASGSKTANKHP
jgi:hypothetical protein